MRYILLFLTCLAILPLSAEIREDIEYHLPNQGQVWIIANEDLKSSKTVKHLKVVYLPENVLKQDAKEFFTVITNNLLDIEDENLTEMLEKGMEIGARISYPDAVVKMNMLENFPHSPLYEYIIKQDHEVKAYGWMRIFLNHPGTVILGYQSKQVDRMDELRPIWTQVLQNAKSVK